ncbi:MAG: hypothetical protein SH808_10300 [Saprospiraceae bacterium]|nr:hypothetical protein [Saprospiraceae bacterium]
MSIPFKNLLLTIILFVLAAVSPNLFVAAQAGLAPLSSMAVKFLLPSVAFILVAIILAKYFQYIDIYQLAMNGLFAGLISTIALEVFREGGFRLGMMPGDLPRLMGVLMLDQFATGPDIRSDISGWAYHFWNGASFGILFSLIMGQNKIWHGLLFGLLIGMGFMISPVVKSLGIGRFGVNFKDGYQFAMTVIVSHAAFGLMLGWILNKWNDGIPHLGVRLKMLMSIR